MLLQKQFLVKTVNFERPKYVGDPINAVKIFNEKEADELIVLDIDATTKSTEINYKLIEMIALECRMPLCYGGGIKTVDQAEHILGMGVEKVSISSAAVTDKKIVGELACRVGSQSVVVVLDVKKDNRDKKYYVVTHNAQRDTGIDAVTCAKELQEEGAGEIVINSYDRDGTMVGYDYELINIIHDAITIPITVLGGAGSLDNISDLIGKYGIIGAAAGSLFVFKGKYKAVLINYPNPTDKEAIIKNTFKH